MGETAKSSESCGSHDLCVTNSRPWNHPVFGATFYRRRECTACKHRFSTYEVSDLMIERAAPDTIAFESTALLTAAKRLVAILERNRK